MIDNGKKTRAQNPRYLAMGAATPTFISGRAPSHFVSLHSRILPSKFGDLVNKHGIAWHEKR